MALLVAAVLPCVAGGKKVYTLPNGVEVHSVRRAGGFTCAPLSALMAVEPWPGGRYETIAEGATPSFLQQAFTPVVEGAAAVGASHMRRPDQTHVNQSGGGAIAGGGDAFSVSDANAGAVAIAGASSTVNNPPAPCPPKPCKPGKSQKPKSPKKPSKNGKH